MVSILRGKRIRWAGIFVLLFLVDSRTGHAEPPGNDWKLFNGPCRSESLASGTIITKRGNLVFNKTSALIRALHCVDVDRVDQGGCIAAYDIVVGEENGCRLNVQISRDSTGDNFTVEKFTFITDSHCPGWIDKHEGTYRYESYLNLDVTAPKNTPSGTEEDYWVCFKSKLAIDGDLTFRSGRIRARVEDLVITGSVGSVGRVNIRCRTAPKRPPPPIYHVPDPEPAPEPEPEAEPEGATLRWDLGMSKGSIQGPDALDTDIEPTIFGSRFSFGNTAVAVFDLGLGADDSFVIFHSGLGAGVVLGGEGLELQPRMMAEMTKTWSDTTENAEDAGTAFGLTVGTTLRLLFPNGAGFHLDAAYYTNIETKYIMNIEIQNQSQRAAAEGEGSLLTFGGGFSFRF